MIRKGIDIISVIALKHLGDCGYYPYHFTDEGSQVQRSSGICSGSHPGIELIWQRLKFTGHF